LNLFARFKRLLPSDPLLAGEVISHNSGGTSTIELPSGGQVRARGQGVAVGSNAYISGGRVQGEAPSLTTYEVDV